MTLVPKVRGPPSPHSLSIRFRPFFNRPYYSKVRLFSVLRRDSLLSAHTVSTPCLFSFSPSILTDLDIPPSAFGSPSKGSLSYSLFFSLIKACLCNRTSITGLDFPLILIKRVSSPVYVFYIVFLHLFPRRLRGRAFSASERTPSIGPKGFFGLFSYPFVLFAIEGV